MMNKRNIELSVLNCNLIFDAIGLKEKPFEAYQTAFLVKILRGPLFHFREILKMENVFKTNIVFYICSLNSNTAISA